MELGQIIKDYRSLNNLSMQEFADRAKISKGYVSMLENGKNYRSGEPIVPTLETVAKISGAMSLSVGALLSMLDDSQRVVINSNDDLEKSYFTIASANGITVDELKKAIDFVKSMKK